MFPFLFQHFDLAPWYTEQEWGRKQWKEIHLEDRPREHKFAMKAFISLVPENMEGNLSERFVGARGGGKQTNIQDGL